MAMSYSPVFSLEPLKTQYGELFTARQTAAHTFAFILFRKGHLCLRSDRRRKKVNKEISVLIFASNVTLAINDQNIQGKFCEELSGIA